jgi:hypothetical protein
VVSFTLHPLYLQDNISDIHLAHFQSECDGEGKITFRPQLSLEENEKLIFLWERENSLIYF